MPNENTFTMVDNNALKRIQDHTESEARARAIGLYVVLVSHRNHTTGEAFPSISLLSDETGMSRKIVMKYIEILENVGVIEVIRGNRRRANLYRFPYQKEHYSKEDIITKKQYKAMLDNDEF